MIKVVLVGTGNVSYHLQKVFSQTAAVNLIEVLPGRSDFTNILSGKNASSEKIKDADLFIIAVSDDAITEVSKHFRKCDKLVVHTSGSISIKNLPKEIRSGVFYPLQTFSKEREVDFKTIPICLEANNPKDLKVLKILAGIISNAVYEVNSEQRRALHLAAVFVNNFSNHLYQIGNEICIENNLSFDLLKPLIMETASKIDTLNPTEAQTGPAKRNDTGTIKKHLEQLTTENQKEIYSVLTHSIQNIYGKKL